MYLYIIPNYPNENKENFIHGMIVDYNTVKFGANTTDKKSFVPDSICLKKNRLVNCEIVNLLLHKDISFYWFYDPTDMNVGLFWAYITVIKNIRR